MFRIVSEVNVLLIFAIFSLVLFLTQSLNSIIVLDVSILGAVDESSKTDKLAGENTIFECKKGYDQKENVCGSICTGNSEGNFSDKCLVSKHCLMNKDTDGYNCTKCPYVYYDRNTQKCTDNFVEGSTKNTSDASTGNNTISPELDIFNNGSD
jgi:hypothetical protein